MCIGTGLTFNHWSTEMVDAYQRDKGSSIDIVPLIQDFLNQYGGIAFCNGAPANTKLF